MAKLIANVFADGEWRGPAHGPCEPPPAVAAGIVNPACWDELPTGTPMTAVELAEAAARAAAPESSSTPETTAPSVPAPSADDPPAPIDEVVTEVRGSLAAHLAALPDDKDALVAFADEHGLDVNRRLGVENLRATLAAKIGD